MSHTTVQYNMFYFNLINKPAFAFQELALKPRKAEIKEIKTREGTKLPKPGAYEKFFFGNIPWDWISIAVKLPGKCFHVAICIWHLCCLNKGKATVKLSMKMLRDEFNVNRQTAYKALAMLEGKGLIIVDRCQGRNSIITVLDNRVKNKSGGKNG